MFPEKNLEAGQDREGNQEADLDGGRKKKQGKIQLVNLLENLKVHPEILGVNQLKDLEENRVKVQVPTHPEVNQEGNPVVEQGRVVDQEISELSNRSRNILMIGTFDYDLNYQKLENTEGINSHALTTKYELCLKC